MAPSSTPDSREIALDINTANSFSATLFNIARGPIESLLRIEHLRSVYSRCAGADSAALFLERALNIFGISMEIGDGDLSKIPLEGPVVVASNHPFGIVDPMALLSIILTVRSDSMVMGNSLLRHIPELKDILIPVNPFGGNKATRENLRSMRYCLQILKDGRLLCMFPSGTVSHIHFHRGNIAVTDPAWSPVAARLVCKTNATVVPVNVSGHNSALFQMAGLIHPLLRTVLLPKETVRMSSRHIRIRIGSAIPADRLKKIPSDDVRIDYLRSRAYLLSEDRKTRILPFRRKPSSLCLKPIAPPQPADLIHREVEALPLKQTLVKMPPFKVFQARADQIPVLLKEIARLRELTFRQEEEGTGEPMDTDIFDSYYRHLVLWDSHKDKIAGAYRLGLSEEILPRFGIQGLYTHTLFHFGSRFINRITPAIELGRSFVTAEYQKTYQPLFLLWKGVARFVYIHPEYKNHFGPVSITQAYKGRSRQLMVEFFKLNNQVTELAGFVRPRKPFRRHLRKNPELRTAVDNLRDIRELNQIVSEIEDDHKGIPVLIRQYLRLGGVVLGFNVDPDFRDALDALVLVDLSQTPLRTLSRYMGKDEAQEFLRYHAAADIARCA